MTDHVLDASVVLAILADEPGAVKGIKLVPRALVGAVNHSEIISKLTEWGRPGDSIIAALKPFDYRIADFTPDLAFKAGLLRDGTKALGLSLGDRACLALAMRERLPAYTTDRRWAELKIGVEVIVIR